MSAPAAAPTRRRARSAAELLAAAREGAAAPLGRLLSLAEQGGPAAREVAEAVYGLTGSAYTIGVTGAPGAGKSTLTNQLVTMLRDAGERVAVLAVDPSSPYSGGAILGDRVRMLDHALDANVFIRSMATRGHLGGLALAAPEAVRVLDAAGFGTIVVETVGVGQVELAIGDTADTTVVVVNPGWGDDVQAAKAGLLEIADVFVVNKADRPGVEQTRVELAHMLDAQAVPPERRPPIVETVASEGAGVDELLEAIRAHRAWLACDERLAARRARQLWEEVEAVLAARLAARTRALLGGERLDDLRARVVGRVLDPWGAADELLAALGDGRRHGASRRSAANPVESFVHRSERSPR